MATLPIPNTASLFTLADFTPSLRADFHRIVSLPNNNPTATLNQLKSLICNTLSVSDFLDELEKNLKHPLSRHERKKLERSLPRHLTIARRTKPQKVAPLLSPVLQHLNPFTMFGAPSNHSTVALLTTQATKLQAKRLDIDAWRTVKASLLNEKLNTSSLELPLASKGSSNDSTQKQKQVEYFVHLEMSKPLCPKDAGKLVPLCADDYHMNTFRHHDVLSRSHCFLGRNCGFRELHDHLGECFHLPDYQHRCDLMGLNQGIDFLKNHEAVASQVASWLGHEPKVDESLLSILRGLRPAHRCTADKFISMLGHGALVSSTCMQDLKDGAQNVSQIASSHPSLIEFAAHVSRTFNHSQDIDFEALKIALEEFVSILAELFLIWEDSYGEETSETQALLSRRASLSLKLAQQFHITPSLMQELEAISVNVASAASVLRKQTTGRNYPKDKLIGTNQHIFTIVGPHTGKYYGDVVILFRPEIMRHPDFNLTFCAGTSFLSGNVVRSKPYMPNFEHSKIEEACQAFHSSKLHPAVEGFERALAFELMAQMRQYSNITLEDILKWWKSRDSHGVLEGHLPSSVSFGFIEKILIPVHVHDSLSIDEKDLLAKWLPSNGVVVYYPYDNVDDLVVQHSFGTNVATLASSGASHGENGAQNLDSHETKGFSFSMINSGSSWKRLPLTIDPVQVRYIYMRVLGSSASFSLKLSDVAGSGLFSIEFSAHGFRLVQLMADGSIEPRSSVCLPHKMDSHLHYREYKLEISENGVMVSLCGASRSCFDAYLKVADASLGENVGISQVPFLFAPSSLFGAMPSMCLSLQCSLESAVVFESFLVTSDPRLERDPHFFFDTPRRTASFDAHNDTSAPSSPHKRLKLDDEASESNDPLVLLLDENGKPASISAELLSRELFIPEEASPLQFISWRWLKGSDFVPYESSVSKLIERSYRLFQANPSRFKVAFISSGMLLEIDFNLMIQYQPSSPQCSRKVLRLNTELSSY